MVSRRLIGVGRPRRRLRRRRRSSPCGCDQRRVARHALLQEQLGGPDHRLGVEPAGHRVAEQGVGQGHQAHPLVVGHVRPDDGRPLALGQPVGRVVDRLVEAVRPLAALARPGVGSSPAASRGATIDGQQPWRTGRRPGRGPGRASAPGRARRTPGTGSRRRRHWALKADSEMPQGTPCLPAVLDLPGDGRRGWPRPASVPGRPRSSSRGIRYSNIVPPQETRPEPAGAADERPAELEPVPPGHLAAGDGQEAGQARLGGQQVVVAPSSRPCGEVVADREQVPLRVVEEPEVHPRPPGPRPARPGAGARPSQSAAADRPDRRRDRAGARRRPASTPRARPARRGGGRPGRRRRRGRRGSPGPGGSPPSVGPHPPSVHRRAPPASQSRRAGTQGASAASSARRSRTCAARRRAQASRPSCSAAEAAFPGSDPADQLDHRPVHPPQPVVPGEQVVGLLAPGGAATGRQASAVAVGDEARACRRAPARPRGRGSARSAFSCRPCFSASRQPSRLPLSTVET